MKWEYEGGGEGTERKGVREEWKMREGKGDEKACHYPLIPLS